jgi:hypothetical protein
MESCDVLMTECSKIWLCPGDVITYSETPDYVHLILSVDDAEVKDPTCFTVLTLCSIKTEPCIDRQFVFSPKSKSKWSVLIKQEKIK